VTALLSAAFSVAPCSALQVLSIQIPTLGNASYCQTLRDTLGGREDLSFRSYWTSDLREIPARLLLRLLRLGAPLRAVRERNADLRQARAELGYAYLGRRLLLRALAEQPADVLHFHTQTPALVAGDFLSRLPTVITTDQTAYRLAEEWGERWRWTHKVSIDLERRAVRAAAAVVTFSEFARRQMIDLHGVQPERVHVIPPGVRSETFAPSPSRQRISDRPVRILFVGGDFVRKGGRDLVAAFTSLDLGTAELHVVTRDVAEVPRHPRIILHANVSPHSSRLHELYDAVDIFALPTHREGFGIAFVEAMAAGLPVVGSTYAPVPEIVLHGETGILVAPGDRAALAAALSRLVADPGLRKRFGEAGARRAMKTYDAQANAQRLAALFHVVARDGR
jgi:glycosyltransferase involved in cell wall biosynthesis